MRRTISILAALLLLASSAGVTTPSGAKALDEPPGSVLPPTELERAMRFRQSFGLSTDPAFVDAVLADPEASQEFGTALTAEEEAEIFRRIQIDAELDVVTTIVDAGRDVFGGLYVDQLDGGAVAVVVKEGAAADTDAVLAAAPDGAEIKFVDGQFSRDELEDSFQAVRASVQCSGGGGRGGRQCWSRRQTQSRRPGDPGVERQQVRRPR